MIHRAWALATCAVIAGLVSVASARADEVSPGDRMENWKVGALAFTAHTPRETTIPDLSSKIRIGTSLMPGLEPYASIRPWISFDTPKADGTAQGIGGILIDIPLGSFVFTPSLGASLVPQVERNGGTTTEFRSQLELGYEFENQSRFSLGYSRITTNGPITGAEQEPNNVFGLYYRLPFGALTGQ